VVEGRWVGPSGTGAVGEGCSNWQKVMPEWGMRHRGRRGVGAGEGHVGRGRQR